MLAILLAAGFLAATNVRGAPTEGELLPRKILALYDRQAITGDYKDIFFTDIHSQAEMPLNYLGMDLVYHEIHSPLPDPKTLADYRGVLTWFPAGYHLPDPAGYCRWLEAALAAGLRVAVLGDPGIFQNGNNEETGPACRSAFARLGIEFGATTKAEPWALKVLNKDSPLVEFERKLDPREYPEFRQVHALPGSVSYLRVEENGKAGTATDAVVITPRGGAALDPFVLYVQEVGTKIEPPHKGAMLEYAESSSEQLRWRIDPFWFFETAFSLRGWPRPDVTTVNGRRLFFSQVDGDGFFNVSEVDRRSWSAEIFLKKVVRRYADSPFTIGLITGYFDMPRFGTPKSLELARELLAAPNVEASSHGYAHPLLWQKRTVALTIPGYRFSARKEIVDSLDFINRRLLPAGKTAALFQWTGNCLPTTDDAAAAAGILNINGGDSRCDRRYDSLAFVMPIGRPLGQVRQIYSGSSNENLYTDLWRGPYYGYREVTETFERTGEPRRLKPVDIYVHFYSAEKTAALQALASIMAWARSRPLFPVFTSEYARIADAFYRVSLRRLGPDRFRIEGGLPLRTIRFDGEQRFPDLGRSRGVLGFKHDQGSLYVSLGPTDPSEIVLTGEPPATPYLREANFLVEDWQAGPQRIRLRKKGWWKGEMVLGGLSPGQPCRITEGGSLIQGRVDKDGLLEARFQDSEGAGPAREVVVDVD